MTHSGPLCSSRMPLSGQCSDYIQLSEKRERQNSTMKSFSKMILTKDGSINEKFQPTQTSRYYYHLSRWLKYFKLSQIHIVDSDDVSQNPFQTVSELEHFLALPNEISNRNFVYNETKVLFPNMTRQRF